jgi:hypothetical protein
MCVRLQYKHLPNQCAITLFSPSSLLHHCFVYGVIFLQLMHSLMLAWIAPCRLFRTFWNTSTSQMSSRYSMLLSLPCSFSAKSSQSISSQLSHCCGVLHLSFRSKSHTTGRQSVFGGLWSVSVVHRVQESMISLDMKTLSGHV